MSLQTRGCKRGLEIIDAKNGAADGATFNFLKNRSFLTSVLASGDFFDVDEISRKFNFIEVYKLKKFG